MAHSGFGCRVQQTVGNGITRTACKLSGVIKAFAASVMATRHRPRDRANDAPVQGFYRQQTAANAENDFFTGQAHDDFSCG